MSKPVTNQPGNQPKSQSVNNSWTQTVITGRLTCHLGGEGEDGKYDGDGHEPRDDVEDPPGAHPAGVVHRHVPGTQRRTRV